MLSFLLSIDLHRVPIPEVASEIREIITKQRHQLHQNVNVELFKVLDNQTLVEGKIEKTG